jgi:NADH dehydrogenase
MQVLILGAGYAGLRTALSLEQLVGEQGVDVQITLVEQNPYHQIIQVLHRTAVAAKDDGAAIALADILKGRRITLAQGRAARIDPLQRCVELADGTVLGYDRLVIALGGESDDRGISGAREHTLPLRSYADALAIRERLTSSYAAAAAEEDPARRRALMTTAIVGGGYTGVQLAGEIADWADTLCARTGAPRGDVRVALLERNNSLLPQFGAWADRDARRILDSKRVSVYLELPVERVEPGVLFVAGGKRLRAATLVWAGGFRAPSLIAAAGLPVDAQGRAVVDRYLRVEDQALIFAIGDCARVRDPASGWLVPATASYAMRQGEHLAASLLAEVQGRPPAAYEPLKLGEIVSVGTDYAIGDPLGVPLTGMPALLLKKGIETWYRSTLFG